MTTVRKLLASLLLICSTAICSTASYAADPDTREGVHVVDVYLEGNETYRINDKSGSLDDLSRELKQSHAKKPINRINVRQGNEKTASAADVFKIVSLAKELGAAPFFEHDGVLKPINVQVVR